MADTDIKNSTDQTKKGGIPLPMLIVTVVLAAALIWLVVKYFDQKSNMIEMEQVLTQEKDSLANELRVMIHSYDTLKNK